jgi:hypothetical protein
MARVRNNESPHPSRRALEVLLERLSDKESEKYLTIQQTKDSPLVA